MAGSFSRKVVDAKVKHYEQQEYLQEILELEHEEQEEVENKLNMSEIKNIKDEEIDRKHTIEKVKRWDVIDQKRIDKESKRKTLSKRETDPFKLAEQIEKQYNIDKQNDSNYQELDLSSVTDDEERERKLKEKAKEGQFLTFKQFLKDKKLKQEEEKVPDKKSKTKPAKEKPINSKRFDEEVKQAPEDDMVKVNESIVNSESDKTEELDFSNHDRSFDKHPLEIDHVSKIDEDSIRMSKNTLRQIKVKKRSRSSGPIGRSFAYVDTQSIAEKGIKKTKNFLKAIKEFLMKQYHNIKEWWNREDEDSEEEMDERFKRSKSLTTPKVNQKLEKVETSVALQEVQSIKNKGETLPKPKGKTIAQIMKSKRTFGKSAQELIFERDESSVDEEEPSILIKRKIDKLREDEAKLKEYELELENELKRLREEPTQEEIDEIKKEYQENYKKKPKKMKKKKSKHSKRHHDMRRMKQEKIRRMLHYEPRKSKEIIKKQPQILVKEFKSDNEEAETPLANKKKTEEKNIKYLEIEVGPLEQSKTPANESSNNNQENIEEIVINEIQDVQAVQSEPKPQNNEEKEQMKPVPKATEIL